MNEYVGNIVPIPHPPRDEDDYPGIDFDSDEPIVCDPNRPDAETCESCQ